MEPNTVSSNPRLRLEELAAQSGVFMNRSPTFNKTQTLPIFTEHDRAAADALVLRKRQEAFSSKSHVFRRSPSQRGFKRDEIYTAMDFVIRGNGSAGVLRCLLDQSRGAKVKKQIFAKEESGKPDINSLLKLATEKVATDMVLLLAQEASATELDSSLQLAVASGNVSCVTALLQNGANPKVCSEEFIEAVECGDRPLVNAFLGAKIPLDPPSLDAALEVAVNTGRIQLVTALLQRGANGDAGDALETAVQGGRIDIAAALALAAKPPSTQRLDLAVRTAYQLNNCSKDRQLTAIELLLCAGANSMCVGSTLVDAVKRNEEQLVALIVAYSGPIVPNICESIISAMWSGKLQLLKILFRADVGAEDASRILSEVPKQGGKFSKADIFYIVSALVGYGACGRALDECLVHAVQRDDLELVEFLVDSYASVGHDKAKALCNAMLSGSMRIFKALLKGVPSQTSLGFCLRSLMSARPNQQLSILTALLAAGAKGKDVDAILVKAVAGSFPIERESFIETLVKHGADVNTENGKCFQTAAVVGDILTLNLLLKGKPSPTPLSTAIPSAFSLHDKELQYAILDLLLLSGAWGPIVDQQFLDLVDLSPVDLSIIELFLDSGKVDINVCDGRAVKLACKRKDKNVLKTLLRYDPSVNTLNAALPCAMALQDHHDQYEFCRELLAAGVCGDALDIALIDEQKSSSSHPHLMELFLDYGANVSFRNGTVIRNAVQSHNVKQLDLLLSKDPSPAVLDAALELLVTVGTGRKIQMARSILDVGKASIHETLDKVLAMAVTSNQTDIAFLEVLLEYGASVDHQQGLAIRKAIENRHFEIVDLLLRKPTSIQTLEGAFESAWGLNRQNRGQYTERIFAAGYNGPLVDGALLEAVQERPYELSDIKLLLDNGASVHHQMHKPLVHAAVSMDTNLLALLLHAVSDDNGVSYAFGEVISASMDWLSDVGRSTLQLLLENGASGNLLGIALILTVENSDNPTISADFTDLLLQFGARVDYQNGQALHSAIKRGQLMSVKKILARQPSINITTTAFSSILSHDLTEDATLQLFELFENAPSGMPDLDSLWGFSDMTQTEPLTFTCVKKYPRGTKVLEKILKAGVHADKTVPLVIEDEEGFEHVSLLLWCLLQPQQHISSHVLDCLLKNGADPNFQSTGSLTTPILIATLERPPETVLMLVQHGADASVNGKHGMTPLFFASQKGQVATVNCLIGAGAMVDDGSLHEAARALHAETVRLLIAHGHNPNFPSMLHEGRCPLAELCFKTSDIGISRAKIRQTMNALVAGKADLTTESQGKPIIMHALDNPTSCVGITTELLASGMWKYVNSECNKFIQDDFVYSPTTYITKCLSSTPREYSSELVRVLKANGCKDVFYKQSGTQPPDMVGAPPDILEEERRRKARLRRLEEEEEDHQVALKRDGEAAAHQQEIVTRNHRLRLQQDRETAAEQEESAQRSAHLKLRLESEATMQRQHFENEQRAAELTQQRELHNLRMQSDRERNHLQIEHEHSSIANQKGLLDHKLAAEMKRLQESESIHLRINQREADLLSRQERFAEKRKEMTNAAAVGGGNGGGGGGEQTKLIEYDGSQLD